MNHRGWEPIWSGTTIPERFASFAAPNDTVVEWAARLPVGGFIFDLGCGVGRHAIYLGERGFRVAGVDIAPTGVQHAVTASATRSFAFGGCVCEMTRLPWPDVTFDAALSTSTIHHACRADIQFAIDEVWRVLKPGGLFLVDFPCTDTADYAYLRAEVTANHVREIEPLTFVDDRPESSDSDAFLPHHYCDEAEVRQLLRRFTLERVWPALRETDQGWLGKWVAWARKEG